YAKELEEKWNVYDKDGDNKTWTYRTSETASFPTCDGNDESGFVSCVYNRDKRPENWLMTKLPLRMPEGKAYVAFYHGIMGGYPEHLKVYFGQSDTPDMSEMTLIGEVRDDSVGWKFKVLPFDIKEAGDYYFAFVHCSEPDQFYLLLDNVEIGEGDFTGTPNLTVVRAVLPPSACGLGNAERVGVQIKNNGTAAIGKMALAYSVDGGVPVEKTITGTLDVGVSRIEYFDLHADFSEEGRDYEVKVTGTVLESDGKEESEFDDNIAQGHVRHFVPVESLPFAVDMARPEDLELLGFDAAYWEYWEEEGMVCAVETEPLITRCMPLEADQMYRFNFEYSAGIDLGFFEPMVISDDFAVVYGPAGTPVSEWTVLRLYEDVYTEETFVYKEIKFRNDQAGVYAFAIVPKEGVWGSYNGTLCLSRMGVEKIQGHDVKLSAIHTSLGLKTPARHAVAARFGVEVVNRGGEEEQEVGVSVRQGETTVGVSEPAVIKTNDTAFFVFPGKLIRPSVGSEVTLTIEADMPVEDEYPDDNRREWTFSVTDGLYAFDADRDEYEDGVGTQEFVFGPVFTLAEPDTLKAMTFGWFDLAGYVSEPMTVGLEVYPVDEAGKAGHCILSYEFERQPEGGLQTVDVPGRILPAGRYFMAVRQLSAANLAIGYDGNPEGLFYGMADDEEYIDAIGSHGNLALRAVFGRSDNIVAKDIEMLAIVKPKEKGAFAANEPIEALYRNNGKDTVDVTFTCNVDGVDVETRTAKVPAYGMDVVRFTADLSKV
ncbi:MAG: choice-of-anchor J domain-containing protein, partial [Bacteroidales bacterium]|nr:choice-of-anchor J domain-containing protein [Bacteroidales bacterium]